jgi:acyl-CoA thioesterase-1
MTRVLLSRIPVAASSRPLFLLLCLMVLIVTSCQQVKNREGSDSAPGVAAPQADDGPSVKGRNETSTPRRPKIVVLGDSLTAGYGLDAGDSFPTVLQHLIDEAGYRHEVMNAGVSGDTSAGGVRRLEWALDVEVEILILALGANDGLRGLPPEELHRNLDAIITRAKARGVQVLLAGMEVPPNMGEAYAASFRSVYSDLARAHGIRLVPFLLAGVAGKSALNQGDGIHPNAAGARLIAETIWEALQPMLTREATQAH